MALAFRMVSLTIKYILSNVVEILFVCARNDDGGSKRDEGTNGVANHRATVFYLGEDCHEDMIAHMSHAPAQFKKYNVTAWSWRANT